MDTETPDYERPVIFAYGDFADLTQHHPSGDPLQHPLPDPHMTGSITDGHH